MRVVWRGCALDFGVAFDGNIAKFEEGEDFLVSLSSCDSSVKRPSFCVGRLEVFGGNPAFPFVGVSFSRPLPQRLPDLMVYGVERLFACSVSVVVAPTPQKWVELTDDCLWFGTDVCL